MTCENWNKRVPILRQRCLERKTSGIPWDGDHRLTVSSLKASEGISSWRMRRGMLTRDLLAGLALAVDDMELLVGRPAPDSQQWQEERREALIWLDANYPQVFTPGQTGHCQLFLDDLFQLGIDGLRSSLEAHLNAAAQPAVDTYQSFILALDGLQLLILHAAETAEAARAAAEPARAVELAEMAAACRWVASQPPVTFRQALQLLWLTILGVQFADRAFLVSPGHIDRLLAPYYAEGIRSGNLTSQDALALIESLYLLINEYIPDGLAVAVMVGGRDAQGQDVTNELSYLCLEALRRTRLIYPTVGVCWHPGTPASLTALAVELMAQGIATPAFFGDDTIQRGLRSYGVPAEEACEYVNSTCVEITPVGSSNVWVASPYFSLCQFLLDEIQTEVRSGAVAGSFEILSH